MESNTDLQLEHYFLSQNDNDKDLPYLHYEVELRSLELTRRGLTAENSTDTILQLTIDSQQGKPDAQKFSEYMVVSALTLHSRAMIEGGVTPDVAYALCDIYFKRLTKCQTPSQRFALMNEALAAFSNQVQKVQQAPSVGTWTDKIIFYVERHLNQPFTLDELAAEFYVDKAHLSRVFKDRTGESIMTYTRGRRIEIAEKTLIYSDLSLSAISELFCFSSQSHFSKAFKEITGKTPRQYREETRKDGTKKK